MTMLQEKDIEILFDGPQGPIGPMRMVTRSTPSMTQKTGAAAPNGTLEAEITYDTIRTEAFMNGQTLPMPDAGSELVGKPVVVTYDRNGDIVDIRGVPTRGLTVDSFKQMVNAFHGDLPVAALGVGEVTSVPMDFSGDVGWDDQVGSRVRRDTAARHDHARHDEDLNHGQQLTVATGPTSA